MSKEALGDGDDALRAERSPSPVVDLDDALATSDGSSERRRPVPSRAGVLAVVLALLVGAGAGALLEHGREERDRHRQADAALRLSAAPGTVTSDPSGVLVQVVVSNEGPRPVQVLGVGVDLPGVYVQSVDPNPAAISPGTSQDLAVHAVIDCARARLGTQDADPGRLEVRARTADGQTRTATLPEQAGDRSWGSLFGGLGCGEDAAAVAVAVDGAPHRAGDVLEVPLRLTGGPRALRVLSLRPQLGRADTTSPPLPVDLPAHGTARVLLRIGPPRCDLLAAGTLGPGVTVPDGVRVTFADAAGPSATRPAATQVLLPLGGDYGQALTAAVRAACPA